MPGLSGRLRLARLAGSYEPVPNLARPGQRALEMRVGRVEGKGWRDGGRKSERNIRKDDVRNIYA